MDRQDRSCLSQLWTPRPLASSSLRRSRHCRHHKALTYPLSSSSSSLSPPSPSLSSSTLSSSPSSAPALSGAAAGAPREGPSPHSTASRLWRRQRWSYGRRRRRGTARCVCRRSGKERRWSSSAPAATTSTRRASTRGSGPTPAVPSAARRSPWRGRRYRTPPPPEIPITSKACPMPQAWFENVSPQLDLSNPAVDGLNTEYWTRSCECPWIPPICPSSIGIPQKLNYSLWSQFGRTGDSSTYELTCSQVHRFESVQLWFGEGSTGSLHTVQSLQTVNHRHGSFKFDASVRGCSEPEPCVH